jgi:hypothetical protein
VPAPPLPAGEQAHIASRPFRPSAREPPSRSLALSHSPSSPLAPSHAQSDGFGRRPCRPGMWPGRRGGRSRAGSDPSHPARAQDRLRGAATAQPRRSHGVVEVQSGRGSNSNNTSPDSLPRSFSIPPPTSSGPSIPHPRPFHRQNHRPQLPACDERTDVLPDLLSSSCYSATALGWTRCHNGRTDRLPDLLQPASLASYRTQPAPTARTAPRRGEIPHPPPLLPLPLPLQTTTN